MGVPGENKRIVFNEKYGNFPGLYSVGYYDSRIGDSLKLIQIKPDHTFYYIRGGSGVLISGERTFHPKPGDLLYIPPEIPVLCYPDDRDPWQYYFFHLEGPFGARFAALLGMEQDCSVCAVNAPEDVNRSFDGLLGPDTPVSMLYHCTLSRLLQLLAISTQAPIEGSAATSRADITKRVRRIMELNYKDPTLSIHTISEMLYVSHTYMSRVFKAEMKLTPIAYLTDLRLSHAAKLLRGQSLPVRQLCTAVGFSDELYFMKCFKKKYGMTVTQYRKQYTK